MFEEVAISVLIYCREVKVLVLSHIRKLVHPLTVSSYEPTDKSRRMNDICSSCDIAHTSTYTDFEGSITMVNRRESVFIF